MNDRALLPAFFISAIAFVTIVATPALVQTYVSIGGMTDRQAGLLFSLEVAGYVVGALLISTVGVRRLRRLSVIGMAAFFIGNALCGVLAGGTITVVALRALAGMGGGILVAASMIVIGATSKPDRNFSWWTVAQILAAALAFAILPDLASRFGLKGFFLPIAAGAALVAPGIRRFPVSAAQPGRAVSVARVDARRKRVAAICLVGIFVYFGGLQAVWIYTERIALRNGLEPQSVQTALTASMAWAIGGALLATSMLRPANRVAILRAMTAVVVASIIAVGYTEHATGYLVGVGLFMASWYVATPALYAVVADIDVSGRLMSWIAIIATTSMSAGPAVGALVVHSSGYSGVVTFGVASAVIGLMLVSPALAYTHAQYRFAEAFKQSHGKP